MRADPIYATRAAAAAARTLQAPDAAGAVDAIEGVLARARRTMRGEPVAR